MTGGRWAPGEGGREWVLHSREFKSYKMQRALETDGDDFCIAVRIYLIPRDNTF